jgi:thiol-disulfide isomerase/thioredoxin
MALDKRWIKISGILLAVLMIGSIFVVGFSGFGNQSVSNETESPGNSTEITGLTREEASERAIDLISDYLVENGTDVELLNITEVECEKLYRLEINLSTDMNSQIVESYITGDGELFFTQGIDIDEFIARNQPPKEMIGGFLTRGDEICEEDGKPIIYFFGHKRCGHCVWEHPVIENVTSDFEGYISVHDNMDSDADRDVFERYSTGHIPMIVLGCKYYRVGSGRNIGEEEEAKVLTALICNLTEGRPSEICNEPEIVELMEEI